VDAFREHAHVAASHLHGHVSGRAGVGDGTQHPGEGHDLDRNHGSLPVWAEETQDQFGSSHSDQSQGGPEDRGYDRDDLDQDVPDPCHILSRLREGLGELQLLYRNLGFPTISVTLPQQRLTNGTVEVKVIEGKLESINVISNRFFTSNNIMRALPSLTTNVLINTKWLQPELDRANLNPDRQIYPVISPGLEPGYTDLNLNVKDRLPLHGHIEFNDKSTPLTPLVRIDTALQYNNL